MAIVNSFVYDFVNEHKVLADRLLIQHAAIVADHLHQTVNYVNNWPSSGVLLSGSNKIDAELLGEKITNTVNYLQGQPLLLTNMGGGSPYQNLTFLKNTSAVFLAKSPLTSLLVKVLTVTFDYCVAPGRENEELRKHFLNNKHPN